MTAAHVQRKIRNHHGNVELQGQRLSAYASTNISTLTKSDRKTSSESGSGADKTDYSKKFYKLDNPKCSCDIGYSSAARGANSINQSSKSTLNRTTTTTTVTSATNTVSKEQSTATHHILSNHRHNVPLQSKSSDQILKCSCNISAVDTTSSTNSSSCAAAAAATETTTKIETALERKQNILLMEEKKTKNLRQAARKEKRDAATSPQLPTRHHSSAVDEKCSEFVADKNNDKLSANFQYNNEQSAKCSGQQSPKNHSMIIRPSPRREIPTRNAATSPQHHNKRDECQAVKKPANAKTAIKTVASKLVLEKSKSLNETRPQRQLRTTRSLSPRPPVRHQQAIIISDENDIVLEVTRSEDFNVPAVAAAVVTTTDSCDRLNVRKASLLSSASPSKIIHKAQSENTSPNLHDGDAFFAGDYAMNMSTGCLVYVPSDPWMKMTGNNESLKYSPKKLPKDSPLRRISKLKNQSTDSSSNNDPWVYRNSDIKPLTKSSPKPILGRQSKSLGGSIQIDGNNKLTALGNNRPKLQRCKSPTISDDAFLQQSITVVNPRKSLSPQKLSTTTTTAAVISNSTISMDKRTQSPNCLLNVATTNSLLQPRHSFSSLTQRDDELQLNIRRLSEQIKPSGTINSSTSTNIASADFSTYLKHCSTAAAKSSAASLLTAKCDSVSKTNASPPTTVTKIDADMVLETTC